MTLRRPSASLATRLNLDIGLRLRTNHVQYGRHTSQSQHRIGRPIHRPFSTPPGLCLPFSFSLPAALIPPAVYIGLALTLWAYKCAMMVIFQNRIIYMPSIPPFSRSERIEDYAGQCGGVRWEERRIRSVDGVEIALCVGEVPGEKAKASTTGNVDDMVGVALADDDKSNMDKRKRRVVVLYFQGNGSSTPPRLPHLSAILNKLKRQNATAPATTSTDYTIVALSYRGYWTSRGRPSQKGIELDAIAALRWVQDTYPNPNPNPNSNPPNPDNGVYYVLWGQSIGAGVATGLVAHHTQDLQRAKRIHGMILETPFLSIRSMLLAMYPQRWVPYRYLWPFLRNWWDSDRALRCIGNQASAATGTVATKVKMKSDDDGSDPGVVGVQRSVSVSMRNGKSHGVGGDAGSASDRPAGRPTCTCTSHPWPRHLPILIVSAANDELVPSEQAVILESLCRENHLAGVERRIVSGALHNDATVRQQGQDAVVGFLKKVSERT